jgi:tetratricopeptide (TPR) repeat protein
MKGLIAGYMKNFALAEIEFKKFIEYDSFNWAGYNDLSWIYFAQGNYHYAEATAREGLAQAAGNPWLHNAIGVSLLAQERGEEALPHFLEAQAGFSKMTPEQWGIAYPGNAPYEHMRGLQESLAAIGRNIERAQESGKDAVRKQ